MNYMIASMKQIHSEYEWEIFFEVNGNKYSVGCRFVEQVLDDGAKIYGYRHKDYDTFEKAIAFWNIQSLVILQSEYSKSQRIKQFECKL